MQVVAFVPSAGPVPPPISVVIPEASASSTICGQMKWTWQSIPPAVRIRPSPAMISVLGPIRSAGFDAVGDVGVPGLAESDDPPIADADVAFDDAPVIEHDRVRDHEIGGALGARRRPLEHRLADRLPAAEHRLVAAAQSSRSTSIQRSVSASRI